MTADPLTQRIAKTLEAYPGPVAAAVSGGPDSMALIWAARNARPDIQALHVDHGLRDGSATEALQVREWLAQMGVPMTLLAWQDPDSGADVQARARQARYELMEDWSRAHGIQALLFAHHQDDQAETVLLRLARGSGVDGLAAMVPDSPPLTGLKAPRRLRPFLDVPKADLVAACRAVGVPFLTDPSNTDPRFDRVRARQFLTNPALPGLNAERLARTATRLSHAAEVLNAVAADLYDRSVMQSAIGALRLDLSIWRQARTETRTRLLAALIRHVSGQTYRPRYQSLIALADRLMNDQTPFTGATLHHSQIMAANGDSVWILREAIDMPTPMPLAAHSDLVWDNRFILKAHDHPIVIRSLGPSGYAQLKDHISSDSHHSMGPKAAYHVIPAAWANEQVIAVPALGLGSDLMSAYLRPLTWHA